MELWHLLYRSVEAYEMDSADLLKLLLDARDFNRAHAITGLLLYRKRRFMQILEGDRETIHRLYRTIQEDPRHLHVVLEIDMPATRRLFPEWHMGFAEPPQMRGKSVMVGLESEDEAEHLLSTLAQAHTTASRMLSFLKEGPVHGAVSV